MIVKINKTGELKELKAIDRDTNCEYTQDLVGNAGGLTDGQFTWSAEDDAYLTDQATYDWWHNYICDQHKSESDIEDLARDLDISYSEAHDLVMRETNNYPADDYNDHRAQIIECVQVVRDNYRSISAAASILGRKGGSSTSERKQAASRENGKLGGRPKKQ